MRNIIRGDYMDSVKGTFQVRVQYDTITKATQQVPGSEGITFTLLAITNTNGQAMAINYKPEFVTYAKPCATISPNNSPRFFTDVNHFYHWLREVILEHAGIV